MTLFNVAAEIAVLVEARDEDAAIEYAIDTLQGKVLRNEFEHVEVHDATAQAIDVD